MLRRLTYTINVCLSIHNLKVIFDQGCYYVFDTRPDTDYLYVTIHNVLHEFLNQRLLVTAVTNIVNLAIETTEEINK